MLGNHLVRARVGGGHRRHRTALGVILAVVVVVVVIASCTHAGNDNQKDTTSGQFAHPSGADQVVIRVFSGGGLVQPVVRVGDSLPRVWISGMAATSGRSPGRPTPRRSSRWRNVESPKPPSRTCSPRRTMPDSSPTHRLRHPENLRCRQHPHSRRHRRQAARRARTRAGYSVADLDAATVAARERVSRFIDLLEHPERIAGVSAPRTYTPTGVAVWVLGPAAASTAMPPATWPLGDLAMVGTPNNLARSVGPVPRRDRRRPPRRGRCDGWDDPNRAVAFRGCSGRS